MNGFKGIEEAFRAHSIVAIGEVHRAENTADFVRDLLHRPSLPQDVRDIAIEFGNSLYQSVLDRYVAGEAVPRSELRKVWRDTTVVNGLWEAPVYEQFLASIRERNQQLPSSLRIRVLAFVSKDCRAGLDVQTRQSGQALNKRLRHSVREILHIRIAVVVCEGQYGY